MDTYLPKLSRGLTRRALLKTGLAAGAALSAEPLLAPGRLRAPGKRRGILPGGAKILAIVIAALVVSAMLAPPVHAQAPASKVTIQGLVDSVTSYASNMSEYDLNMQRRDSEMLFRTRARPDIIGEVGTSKFVLGLELDYTYGQVSSNNDQNSGLTNFRGSEHFGSSSGGTLNTDLARLIEVKWAYTEFDLPLPMATRLRIGAQPFDATYKPGIYANSDFTGFNLDTVVSPDAKLHLTYVFITDHGTGRGDGFLQGNSFAMIADPEITLVKGIDIRPIYSYIFVGGASSTSPSGPRLLTAGVANSRCAGQDSSLTVTPATGTAVAGTAGSTTTLPGGFGAPTAVGGATPCFPDGGRENRSTVGFDARLRRGPFSLDPTFLYQFGERTLVSPAGFQYAGKQHAQKMSAYLADIRGGWQTGPLLLEVAGIYTSGNKAQEDVRDSTRALNYFQPLATDSLFYAGWAEMWGGSGVDYFQGFRSNGTGINPKRSPSYDKYGLARIGTRASYAVTPNFTVRSSLTASWTAEKVNTRGTIGAAGITPLSGVVNQRGSNSYLGTELDLGLRYKLAPGVTFDLVGGYNWSGHAVADAFATSINGGDGTNITRPAMNPKDAQIVSARFRYTF
jgi:hypothetical protein